MVRFVFDEGEVDQSRRKGEFTIGGDSQGATFRCVDLPLPGRLAATAPADGTGKRISSRTWWYRAGLYQVRRCSDRCTNAAAVSSTAALKSSSRSEPMCLLLSNLRQIRSYSQ